ncbi:hypothetical protein OPV22_014322 [Ensete ventricosum]|uniref:NADP-dependent oxidoreductase domain-containing protein n=1 Tax=Ensete ventricosum TaxID=4639 RepID=A0AAV8RBL9_ENSVE|nr:hypothetical protein OPV22_014322 [Ensete ventricosum]
MATLDRRELANTGLKLSCLGFGASPLGNVFGHVSHADAVAAVRLALQLGINFFDTSPYYGGTVSETVLGNCLHELNVPREDIVVSTKCGRYIDGFDFSAERVTRSIDESLARLKLDYVDILHCHDIEFGSLDQIVNETIPALQKIKEAGKARFIGITGLPLGIFTYVLDRVPPDNGPPEWHPASSELKSACRAAVSHCKKKGKNISKIALQYSLMNKEISTVLVGMNSPKQVGENVAAALELSSLGIDEDLLHEVEAILEPVKNQTWPSGIQQP